MRKPIGLWCVPCGNRCGNAGDMVARTLVQHFWRRHFRWSPRYWGRGLEIVLPDQADVVATGSILQGLPPTYTGIVWGTGLLFEHQRANLPEADIRAVRGYLTAARVNGGLTDVAVGDTALLVSELPFPKGDGKRYEVGIVPHYVDAENQGVRDWLARLPGDTTAIDICSRVPDVLRAISECRYILSSSLHGLVFADALGIPNAWIVLSNRVGEGSTFKFRDYYSVFGIADPLPFPWHLGMDPSDIQKHPWERPGLETIQENLKKCLQ